MYHNYYINIFGYFGSLASKTCKSIETHNFLIFTNTFFFSFKDTIKYKEQRTAANRSNSTTDDVRKG